MQLDWHLITALIERWRPETHTFQMRCGECTIILLDVAVQLGLLVDGELVVGSLNYDWKVLCEDHLGVLLLDMKGQWLSLPWLAEQFTELPQDADVVSIRDMLVHTQLIGGFLFDDKLNTLVHCIFLSLLIDFDQADTYAWGATCLAWLYRKLCRASNTWSLEMINPLMFLQVWTYDRISYCAPHVPLQVLVGRHLSFKYYFLYIFF